MNTETRILWLKGASATVIAFGVAFMLSTIPALSAPMALLTDLIFWPLDGGQNLAAAPSRLLLAISGGVMAGWGLLLWLISTRLYPENPHLARMMILGSVGTWFIVDSLGSILAGAWLNALFNVVFLELFLIPLWRAPAASEDQAEIGLNAEA